MIDATDIAVGEMFVSGLMIGSYLAGIVLPVAFVLWIFFDYGSRK